MQDKEVCELFDRNFMTGFLTDLIVITKKLNKLQTGVSLGQFSKPYMIPEIDDKLNAISEIISSDIDSLEYTYQKGMEYMGNTCGDDWKVVDVLNGIDNLRSTLDFFRARL